MKKVNIASKTKSDTMEDVIEVIHRIARHNGSTERVVLKTNREGIVSIDTYANRKHTMGYFAVLYLIDSLNQSAIAYTRPGWSGAWFNIYVKNPQELIDYLES